MNSLKLFSHLMVLFISCYSGCQSQQLRMKITEVEVWNDNEPRSVIYTQQKLIKVSEDQDEYFFEDQELASVCGQRFTSQDVEIKNAHGRSLGFSLIKANKNLTLQCMFATNEDLQLFFRQQRKTLILQDLNSVRVRRSLILTSDGRMQVITNDGLLYRKQIDRPQEVGATYSYNLVRQISSLDPQTGATIQTQEIAAVFISRKFNITPTTTGRDKLGVFLPFLPNSAVLLCFNDSRNVSRFRTMVQGDTDPDINCSLSRIIGRNTQFVHEYELFHAPDLP